MKIWFHPESPYARRVLCFLDWTGIAAERISLALENREHRDEAYLKINPFARVPAIVDNGFALSESLAILRYLVARDELWNWYPQDLRGRAVADQWLEYVSQRACEQVHFWLANTRPWPTWRSIRLPLWRGRLALICRRMPPMWRFGLGKWLP